MTTFIAASILVGLFVVVLIMIEHTHHRSANMPHAPYGGGEAKSDLDLFRVLHDLSARGQH